jgi:hypothetical protein
LRLLRTNALTIATARAARGGVEPSCVRSDEQAQPEDELVPGALADPLLLPDALPLLVPPLLLDEARPPLEELPPLLETVASWSPEEPASELPLPASLSPVLPESDPPSLTEPATSQGATQ